MIFARAAFFLALTFVAAVGHATPPLLAGGQPCLNDGDCTSAACNGAGTYVLDGSVASYGTRALGSATYSSDSSSQCRAGIGEDMTAEEDIACASDNDCVTNEVCNYSGFCVAGVEARCAVEFPLATVPEWARPGAVELRVRNWAGKILAPTHFALYVGTGSVNYAALDDGQPIGGQITASVDSVQSLDVTAAYVAIGGRADYIGVRVSDPTRPAVHDAAGGPFSFWESIGTDNAMELTIHTFGTCAQGPGALETITDLPVGDATCSNGGVRVDRGLDDGGTSDTAGDGILGPTEIDESHVVCAGTDGANGAAGPSGATGATGPAGAAGADGTAGAAGAVGSAGPAGKGGCHQTGGGSLAEAALACIAVLTIRRSRRRR